MPAQTRLRPYTSGTADRPKGATLTHRNLLVGDIGGFDGDGYLTLRDRSKDLKDQRRREEAAGMG
jgi:long-subunit acyl-CoA synthetase (AMP-forming)